MGPVHTSTHPISPHCFSGWSPGWSPDRPHGSRPASGRVLAPTVALLLAGFLALSAPEAASAQTEAEDLCANIEEAPETAEGFFTTLEKGFGSIDAIFGKWIVGPIATVLFFDIAFWDNSDKAAEGRAAAAGLNDAERRAFFSAEGDPRIATCESFGLSDCAEIVGGQSGTLTGRACRAGLESDRVRALLSEPSDPGAAYLKSIGKPAAAASDITNGLSMPFIVIWLVLGALFFTFRFQLINLRAFWHAIQVTRGKFDNPDDPGEVSHFQALSSALSATVGLGNIAGVAVAVGAGGPGAVFWMVLAGFLGMSSKFAECTLGQLYRQVDENGQVSGGPMQYLKRGLAEIPGFGGLGKFLAVLFAIMCIGGSFGGGNMFQANQSAAQMAEVVPFIGTDFGKLIYGVVLSALVGVVIIGGIKRIGKVAGYIVPIMCGIYVLAGLVVIVMHADHVGPAFSHIFSMAFTPEAGLGGLLGVLVQGFKRAAFSNEAGTGSASIAHSAAATDEPVREGIVALLEPFIDTIIVCTMTALVLVITESYMQVDGNGAQLQGIAMTSWAFDSALPGFSVLLSFAAFAFAFSTMISWSYYGERCWAFLFGSSSPRLSLIYRVIFLLFVVLGSVLELGSVITFSDLMILGMALPNILGVVILSNKVAAALKDYWGRYKSGAMNKTAG